MSKTVLITGASRGIGAFAARAFAAEGYKVAVNYFKSENEAISLAKEICGIAVKADVSDPLQAEELAKKTLENFGHIDVLVNNAAIALTQKVICDVGADEWDRLFAVNVRGMFNCTKAALDSMITRQNGKIINISSVWGITGGSCEVAYSASKAAVIGFTKALAKETAPSRITVNCIAPGVIKTDMNAHLSEQDYAALKEETPLGRIGTPQDVAGAMLFLASPAADFITGQVIAADGGISI